MATQAEMKQELEDLEGEIEKAEFERDDAEDPAAREGIEDRLDNMYERREELQGALD